MIKTLELGQVFLDKDIYPRMQHGWQTAYDYSQSMKTGAIFPPIIVNLFAGKYYLIDGKHRLEAYKLNKVKRVKCQVLNLKTRKTMYELAIKSNIGNGRSLSMQDKMMICGKLKTMNFSLPQISKIVQIPMDKITKFTATRITSDINGEEVYLRAPLEHLSQKIVPEEFNDMQNDIIGTSQEQIINEVITLFENGLINKKDKKVMNDLKILYQLIKEFILKRRKK